MNTEKHTTIKIWTDTLKNLRHIHAETGETMVVILDRIVRQELERQNITRPRKYRKDYQEGE